MSHAHRPVIVRLAAAALLAGALAAAGCAPPPPRHAASTLAPTFGADRPASAAVAAELWFTGASNIRNFTCRARAASMSVTLAPGATVDTVLRSEMAAVAATVAVPAAALDCGLDKMNGDLHKALKAQSAPTIEFRLIGYTPSRDRATATLDGALSVAGVERPLSVAVTVERPTPDAVRLRGERTIRPTDYGIEPPRRFLGLLRVRNEVTVHFDVTVVGAGE